jgi:formylglycine-generating enzyme required for sulfatase activity
VAKIFVNYRRDDVPGDARGVREGLAAKFGQANVFMDVDNLLAGQRFDIELAKALDACDVLIAIIGPRWMDLLKGRMAGGERDYVREEIAAALAREIVVIPVRVGRDGQMPLFPRAEELPDEIRDLVLYQKHDVAHERFGRDIADLVQAVVTVRRVGQPVPVWQRPPLVAALAVVVLAVGYAGAHQAGVPVPWPWAVAPPVESIQDRLATAAAGVAKDVEAARQRAGEKLAASSDAIRAASQKFSGGGAADEAAKQKAAADAAARKMPAAGDVFRDCPECPEMVVVPAGEFTMGSNEAADEKPPHKVTIAKPFAVGRFTVTFDEWDACVADGGCKTKPSDKGWGRGRMPVINVNWSDVANEYLPWLSKKSGKSYRLLTEAEWEYAARAGTTTKYFWGDEIGKGNANCDGCGSQWDYKQTAPVGSFKSNAFGLYDMHGNVWQWVEDAWLPDYQGALVDGSAWTGRGSNSGVLRGGSWSYNPQGIRSAVRYDNRRGYSSSVAGFRVARALP